MEPTAFPQTNRTLLRPNSLTDEQCESLPIYYNDDENTCLSCWKATSWKERLSFLIFGKVWLWVWSRTTQPPVSIAVTKTPFLKLLDSYACIRKTKAND